MPGYSLREEGRGIRVNGKRFLPSIVAVILSPYAIVTLSLLKSTPSGIVTLTVTVTGIKNGRYGRARFYYITMN